MGVRTYYFTDHKTWVDCIAEARYIYDGSEGIPRNYIDLSCRRRAHCHPEDKFNLEFGKELARAKAFVVLNKKKLDYLYELSRKFSKEQNYSRKILEPIRKQFKSRLTELNELELEEIYQAIEEHRAELRSNKKW